MSLAFNDQYQLGLSNIKKAIEADLGHAGANMSPNSVFFRRTQRNYGGVPSNTTVAAVPLDAPRITVEFTQQEVLDCSGGVNRGDVREKVRLYSAAYVKFRSSPERIAQGFSAQRRRPYHPAEAA